MPQITEQHLKLLKMGEIENDVLTCPVCLGSGYCIEKMERVMCSYCHGRGRVSEFLRNVPYNPRAFPTRPQKCPCCGRPKGSR